MRRLVEKWEELKKALDHKKSVSSAAVVASEPKEFPEPHPDHLPSVKYGSKNIPGASDISPDYNDENMGFAKIKGTPVVVRHGAAAQRTDVEHQMSKLLGADGMVPESKYDQGLNHPVHHGQPTHDPHLHGGTSFQEHSDGKNISDAMDDEALTSKLKDQWKGGDLHKLWALHFISNNGDMHAGNFNVGKDGVKAFDSDLAFHELPSGHTLHTSSENPEPQLRYHSHSMNQLPSYLAPFVVNPKGQDDDKDVVEKHKDQQPSVKAINDHAEKINPELFEQFGPHAAERAAQAKTALSSADPTGEMVKLWHSHKDHTGDLNGQKAIRPAGPAA